MTDLPLPHTFVVAGCQRCGTTWLDAALREHPEVYLPAEKQSYFFDRNYALGVAAYRSRFDGVTAAHRAVGEVATGYCLPEVVPRVARHLPGVKVIMIARNPVERAFSNFQLRQYEEGWESFAEAMQTSGDLFARGLYAEQLTALQAHWPAEQIKVVLYDDLVDDPAGLLQDLFAFIGVDPGFPSSMLGVRKNSALFPHLRQRLKGLGLGHAVKALARSPAGDLVRRWAHGRGARGDADRIDPQLRAEIAARYAVHNRAFEAMLGRPLHGWDR